MIAGLDGVAHRPDRAEVGDLERNALRLQAHVEGPRPRVPALVDAVVDRPHLRLVEAREEGIHGGHDIGVRVERPAREAYVGGRVVPIAAHQVAAAGDDADGHAAGDGLAPGDHVGLDAEVFLRTGPRDPEADDDLVEDQNDTALRAHLAQGLQPLRVGGPAGVAPRRAVDQRRIARRRPVRVQDLDRIDQHAGDVPARAQHAQRLFRHFRERIGVARRDRVADARLHVAPPAVIGAREAHDVPPLGVVAGKPHRLHHGFRAGHVERHFVEPRQRPDGGDVAGDGGVIGAEHGAQRFGRTAALGHALFIEVVAEHVDAVRAGQVVGHVAVEVGHGHAGGAGREGARAQVPRNVAAELERHTVHVRELQVRDALARLLGQCPRLGRALGIKLGKPLEGGPALRRDVGRRPVHIEEAGFGILVIGHEPGNAPRPLRMPCERGMLGA